MLQELAKNIWTASVHHSFIGLHVGTRMTVIRLSSGKLLLHSPVRSRSSFAVRSTRSGQSRISSVQNLFHHMYAS